jgi:hypothetical protein
LRTAGAGPEAIGASTTENFLHPAGPGKHCVGAITTIQDLTPDTAGAQIIGKAAAKDGFNIRKPVIARSASHDAAAEIDIHRTCGIRVADPIKAGITANGVVTGAAVQDVIPDPATQTVIAIAPKELVIAAAARKAVIARTTFKLVITGLARSGIIACPDGQDIGLAIAGNPVMPCASDHILNA